ncbi:MAG: hypothetical protein ACQEQ4_10120 [Fibrobacterota bacterium]
MKKQLQQGIKITIYGMLAVCCTGVILSPFLLKIWKEGEAQVLSMKKNELMREKKELESRILSLQHNIHNLQKPEHLSEYTQNFPNLHPAPAGNIFYLHRDRYAEKEPSGGVWYTILHSFLRIY